MRSTPKFSVITVVFNGLETIERTLISVREQDYPHIEHVIIDGGSTDGALELIKKYQDGIGYFVSEKDNGLYDAMNKGLKAATGEFVIFINAGDCFFEADTLSKVAAVSEGADVLYGECVMTENDGAIIGSRRLTPPSELNWKSLRMGMLVSHQSIFVKRNLAPSYDLKYKLAADFNWVLNSLKVSSKIVNTNLIISKFLDGGMTKQNIVPGLKERYKIMSNNFGSVSTFFRHFVIGTKFLWYVFQNKRF